MYFQNIIMYTNQLSNVGSFAKYIISVFHCAKAIILCLKGNV